MIRTINWLVFLFSGLIYGSVFISPEQFELSGILALCIPFTLITNFLLVAICWLTSRKIQWAALLSAIAGLYFIPQLCQYHRLSPRTRGIQVLSYNTRLMRSPKTDANTTKKWQYSDQLIEWIAQEPSPIKCFQEFYSDGRWKKLNVSKKLKVKGYHTFVLNYDEYAEDDEYSRGMAIFSKFPIVHQGQIDINEDRLNQAIFADLLIGTQDTLRIYNLHLHSMGINQEQTIREPSKIYATIFKKFKNGQKVRSKQAREILEHILSSPHPVIVCGDFNDPPISYNYQQYCRHLNNAFQSAGNGFGFTLHGPLFFLRIDQQFYSPSLEVEYFETLRKVSFSDHFPIRGKYRL